MVLLDPSPIVRLNRAVAVAEVDGPEVGLAEIDRLAEVLDGYHASGPTSPAAATSSPADRQVEPARSSTVRGKSVQVVSGRTRDSYSRAIPGSGHVYCRYRRGRD
jgi:hypothetical protein